MDSTIDWDGLAKRQSKTMIDRWNKASETKSTNHMLFHKTYNRTKNNRLPYYLKKKLEEQNG